MCYQTLLFTGIEQSFESLESGIGAFTIKGRSASATMPTVCLRNLAHRLCYNTSLFIAFLYSTGMHKLVISMPFGDIVV